MFKKQVIFIFLAAFVFLGCSSKVLTYTPQPKLQWIDARDYVEELMMTQHPKWRPEHILTTVDYMELDYGVTYTSGGTSFGMSMGHMAVGTTITNARERRNIERIYFRHINHIQLMEYTRGGTPWFVISAIDSRGKVMRHLFYGRDLESAQSFADALAVLIEKAPR